VLQSHYKHNAQPLADYSREQRARLGAAAVERLLDGQHRVLVGLVKNDIATTPLDVVVSSKKPLDVGLLELARVLAK